MKGFYNDPNEINDLLRAAHQMGGKLVIDVRSPNGGDGMIQDLLESHLTNLRNIYKYRTASVLDRVSEQIRSQGDGWVANEVLGIKTAFLKVAEITPEQLEQLRKKALPLIRHLRETVFNGTSEDIQNSDQMTEFFDKLSVLKREIEKPNPSLETLNTYAGYFSRPDVQSGNFNHGDVNVKRWLDAIGDKEKAAAAFQTYKGLAGELKSAVSAVTTGSLSGQTQTNSKTEGPKLDNQKGGETAPTVPGQTKTPATPGVKQEDKVPAGKIDNKIHLISFSSPFTGDRVDDWDFASVMTEANKNPIYFVRNLQAKNIIPKKWSDADIAHGADGQQMDALFKAIQDAMLKSGVEPDDSKELIWGMRNYLKEMSSVVSGRTDKNVQTVVDYATAIMPDYMKDIRTSTNAMKGLINIFYRNNWGTAVGMVLPDVARDYTVKIRDSILSIHNDFQKEFDGKEKADPTRARSTGDEEGRGYQDRDIGTGQKANIGSSPWQMFARQFPSFQQDEPAMKAWLLRLMPGNPDYEARRREIPPPPPAANGDAAGDEAYRLYYENEAIWDQMNQAQRKEWLDNSKSRQVSLKDAGYNPAVYQPVGDQAQQQAPAPTSTSTEVKQPVAPAPAGSPKVARMPLSLKQIRGM